MNVKVKGAKKTSSSSRTPVVATDSAQSKTYIKILYGYAEGEIEGPVNGAQGIYLEDTPILDSNGNKNLNLSHGIIEMEPMIKLTLRVFRKYPARLM
ncbi:hypothetical protein OK024_08880 [Acinetobacter sp. UGAL515B_02]|nr:hypothetical protein [Acinetobacter sp. UGAL515B_02]WON79092.1 hypothetical protein OK024_08880 [Acinetobacter sp. UGAL515B_02]